MHVTITPDALHLSLLQQQATYVHVQALAAAVWEIQHNLNKWPSVTVVESTNVVCLPEVEYVNENVIRLTFLAALSGRAFLN